MVKIAEERPALASTVEFIKKKGSLPEREQAAVALQYLDSIGTMYAAVQQMGVQLEKTKVNLEAAYWGDDIPELTKELADALDAQKASLMSAQAGWKRLGLQVPPSVSTVSTSQLPQLLLAASEQGKAQDPHMPTVQRVLGAFVMNADTDSELKQVLQHYDKRQTKVAPELILKVLEDVDQYDEYYSKIQSNKKNAEHFRKLEAIVKTHAESPPSLVVNGRQTIVASIDDAIELVAHPSRAPVSTDPGYILCAQLEASAGSVHVYGLVANLVHSSGLVGAVVLCGGVKGLARIVFKTLTKYSGDTMPGFGPLHSPSRRHARRGHCP